jgi:prephenate dehydrogenase
MSELAGPVEIVGAGLIGTSLGLALRRAGVEVLLSESHPDTLRTATGMGAGRPATPDDEPRIVVVAVPPDHLGAVIRNALSRTAATGAVVTDVGSVKTGPLAELDGVEGLSRYVGGHPMAGSERSGPLAASAALFDGRPWAVTPHASAHAGTVGLVESLVLECGAAPLRMDPAEHDRAVARISHLPHLAAVLVAGRLAAAPAEHLALSGQGVRDVTRVAASDPGLWRQILEANSEAVLDLLAEVRADLDALITAVASDSAADLVEILMRGNAGTRAIPGKHGGPARPTRSVFVAVPDHPGELARLFGDAGEIGVNIEDVHIDHDPGRPVGLTELVVERASAEMLLAALESRGWTTHR